MNNNKQRILLQIVIAVIGTSIGLFFSMQTTIIHNYEHGSLLNESGMNHGYLDVDSDSILPEIRQVEIIKDPMSGWNVHIETSNFEFSPENASTKHIQGIGHAHLLINGAKVARIYSNWFHIPTVEYPIDEIEITLNANNHSIMRVNGSPISAVVYNFNETKLLTKFNN